MRGADQRDGARVLLALRDAYRALADSDRALQMQAYMKSAMPYHGVPSQEMRRVCREVFGGIDLGDAERWRTLVLAIFRGATHREEWYAALELVGDRRVTGKKIVKTYQTLDALPMYEEMIVTGAWWDIVDALASHRVGGLLELWPQEMKPRLRDWSRDPNMWKRRTAILSQLGFKERTDLPFLYECIEPSLAERDFFLRKAIGWALRQYAWTDPDEIVRYTTRMKSRLSPLSLREALKNVAS